MRTHQKSNRAGIAKATSSTKRRGHVPNNDDALVALRALPQTYAQVGDRLLDCMYRSAADPHQTRTLSRHLEWLGSRARVINSFIEAGDGALSYLCSATEAPERLASLVQLTARNAAADRLQVALFMLEKIDEELRLA
jgi:type IV secretory pathway VirJ component